MCTIKKFDISEVEIALVESVYLHLATRLGMSGAIPPHMCAFIAYRGQLYLYLILKRGMHIHSSCLSFLSTWTVTLTITFTAACECQAVYTGDICFLPNFIIEDVPSCFKMLNQLRETVFSLEQEHRSYLRLLARETKYGSK